MVWVIRGRFRWLHDGYKSRNFEISNPQEYEFFRFEVYSHWDGNVTNVMELGQRVLNE